MSNPEERAAQIRQNQKRLREKKIKDGKIWLANRKALLDQRQKMFDDQYPLRHPSDNMERLQDLEAMQFQIEIHEWELEQYIKDTEEYFGE